MAAPTTVSSKKRAPRVAAVPTKSMEEIVFRSNSVAYGCAPFSNFAPYLKPGAKAAALANWGDRIGYTGEEGCFILPMPYLDSKGKLILPGPSIESSNAPMTGSMWTCVEHYYQFSVWMERDADYATTVIRPLIEGLAIKKASGKGTYSTWLKGTGVCRTKVAAEIRHAEVVKRPDVATKIRVMKMALQAKFGQCPVLRKLLLTTGEARLKEKGDTGKGLWVGNGGNKLGLLLEEVRDELRATSSPAAAAPVTTPSSDNGTSSAVEIKSGAPKPTKKYKRKLSPPAPDASEGGTTWSISMKADNISDQLYHLLHQFPWPDWMVDQVILEYLLDKLNGKKSHTATVSSSYDKVSDWIAQCEANLPAMAAADASMVASRTSKQRETEFPLGEEPTSIRFAGGGGSNKKARWLI
jgi:predicted NAD-dependent protein-ADP-ribosyltransferase YbiA (DUF1768 family)